MKKAVIAAIGICVVVGLAALGAPLWVCFAAGFLCGLALGAEC
jgi:hypothetical protein